MRSVDDHDVGVGPVTLELQKAYLDTVRGKTDRWGHWLDRVAVENIDGREEPRHAEDPALVAAVPRRARRGACPRGLLKRKLAYLVIERFELAFAEKVCAPMRFGLRHEWPAPS